MLVQIATQPINRIEELDLGTERGDSSLYPSTSNLYSCSGSHFVPA